MVGRVGVQQVAMFVDVGATVCFISVNQLNKLGVTYEKSESPSHITPVDGIPVQVLGIVTLPVIVNSNTTLSIKFVYYLNVQCSS